MTPNIRLTGAQPNFRSESDIRIADDPSKIVGACNAVTDGPLAVFSSGDGGGTWAQTFLPTVTGDMFQGDPAVEWTSDGTAWALCVGIGNLGGTANVVRSFKLPSGGSWAFDSVVSGAQHNVDKPMLWVDHSATSAHRDNLYALWWNNGPTFVSRRAGTGGTWSAPLQVSGPETTGGSDGGDIKTNAFGDVFAFWPSEVEQTLNVAVSTDGGVSFGTPVQIATTFGAFLFSLPAQDSRRVLLYITGGAYRTSSLNHVYALWMDLEGGAGCNSSANEPGSNVASACKTRIWFSRSVDGGAHWSVPVKINDQAGLNDQFFPRLAVDDTNGDMMVVYYDTVGDPGRLKTDLWMQTCVDHGVTWSAPQKITAAETDETAAGVNGNQYGDYIGLSVRNGQYFACWTDRRNGGREEIWGAPLKVVRKACYFNLDRDHYGADEIDGLRSQSPAMPKTAIVQTAFWVVVDGFTARELGITGPGSTGLGPPITFTTPSSAVAPGVSATCTSVDSDDPLFPLDELQRFRFGYDVSFGVDDTAFNAFAADGETVTLSTTFSGLPASADVVFMKQPDPYIKQGAHDWWLSNDIRLIQVAQGDAAFGVTMGTDPHQFLLDVTSALELGQGTAGGQSFDTNTTEDNEVISVAPQTMRGGHLVNVYNFAIARVHYQGLAVAANDVRVFFRLFAANSTATDFEPGRHTTYGRDPGTYPVPAAQFGQHVTPVAGVAGGEYVSVPCFSTARQNPAQAGAANSLPALQFDAPINDRTIAATGGPLHDTFYGCYLDINGSAGVFPAGGMAPAGNEDGPWPPGSGVALEPLRAAFIRNEHQCLVAEIAFDPDPVNPGTQPWNTDKLAQRNISWSTVAL
jgi:hypothetical protein